MNVDPCEAHAEYCALTPCTCKTAGDTTQDRSSEEKLILNYNYGMTPPVCRYYLHSTCSYGDTCRNLHPADAAPHAVVGSCVGLDGKLYPRRPGDDNCPEFNWRGTCKFEMRCWYDHPPEAVEAAREAEARHKENQLKRDREAKERKQKFAKAKEAAQSAQWHEDVKLYKDLPQVAPDASACYVVVDVESNSGTDSDNPSLLFTASRDLKKYMETCNRLWRTYSWRQLDEGTATPETGARAAAGENGRHVKRGPSRWESYQPPPARKKKHKKQKAQDNTLVKEDVEGKVRCPACELHFMAPTIEYRYDMDVNFYPRATDSRYDTNKHYYAKFGGLLKHMQDGHASYHEGTNPWGGGGKRFYRDSTDEDRVIDKMIDVTGKDSKTVAEVLLDLASFYRSRKQAPPGGWPLCWTADIYDRAKQAFDLWAKRDGRIEAVWSDERPCNTIKDRYPDVDLGCVWPHMEIKLSVRDRMRQLARRYSDTPWEDDAPAAAEAETQDAADTGTRDEGDEERDGEGEEGEDDDGDSWDYYADERDCRAPDSEPESCAGSSLGSDMSY